MGLDMYLTAKKSFHDKDWVNDEQEKKVHREVSKMIPFYESGNLNYIEIGFEAGYWRKANAIHKWFVAACQDGIDDCRTSWIDKDKLKTLRDKCEDVLKDLSQAHLILPTEEGFFFGTQTYDEWYVQSLKDTIEIIDKGMKLPDGWEFYYHSSW